MSLTQEFGLIGHTLRRLRAKYGPESQLPFWAPDMAQLKWKDYAISTYAFAATLLACLLQAHLKSSQIWFCFRLQCIPLKQTSPLLGLDYPFVMTFQAHLTAKLNTYRVSRLHLYSNGLAFGAQSMSKGLDPQPLGALSCYHQTH